jgi:uncharacterized protein (UPF0371 family)
MTQDASDILLKKRPSAAKTLLRGASPASKKNAHVQRLNDELAEDIIASSKNNPLVRLGIETIGVKQMTTLFRGNLNAAEFSPKGYKKGALRKLGHNPASPVDTTKPTVVVAAKNMADQGLRTARSDMGHEYLHAGIASLADFKKHNIGKSLEEAIARHHDMVTGDKDEVNRAKRYFKATYKDPTYAHKVAKELYGQLNEKASLKREQNIIRNRNKAMGE